MNNETIAGKLDRLDTASVGLSTLAVVGDLNPVVQNVVAGTLCLVVVGRMAADLVYRRRPD